MRGRSTRSTSGSKPFKLLKGSRSTSGRRRRSTCPTSCSARCDWVVASVHSSLGQRPDRADRRGDGEPARGLIGHPTGRKINRRPPSDIDFERVVETALATGTFLEIDSQPDRLDLRDTHARAAAEAGAQDRDHERRAPDLRARLRRVRDRPGAPGLADEGASAEHPHLAAAEEAAQEVKLFRQGSALRAPRPSLTVRGRSGQYFNTAAESIVPFSGGRRRRSRASPG